MPERFTGFPPQGIVFLSGLGADNTKTYFDAHRADYDRYLAAPLKTLVVDVADRLRGTVAPALRADPTVGKSLFRINRDTRFSKDKTLYRPWVDAVWWDGDDDARRAPAYIFRFAADHLVIGAGVMGLRDQQSDRYRAAVADDTTGAALAAVLSELTADMPSVQITSRTRKRVPAPYPRDHPRGELLRCDALHASTTRPHPRTLSSARFAGWLASQLESFAPLHRWLVEQLTVA